MTTVFIKPNSLIARVAAFRLRTNRVAIVIGHTIYLHGVSARDFIADKHWLCHELKHVAQYEDMGTVPFLYRYLAESIRKGYHDNLLEQEARKAAADHSLIHRYRLTVL